MNSLPAHIAAKIEPEPMSGCWLWSGSQHRLGYGRLAVQRRVRMAHRVVYELLRGQIPADLELDHRCRVPACVNPGHMEPVTHRENLRRGRWGQTIRCTRGHPYDATNTRTIAWRNKVQRVCRACDRDRKRASR